MKLINIFYSALLGIFISKYLSNSYAIRVKKQCRLEDDFQNCVIDNFNKLNEFQITCDSNIGSYFNLIILPNQRLDFQSPLNIFNCSFENLILNNFKSISLSNNQFLMRFQKLAIYNSDFSFTDLPRNSSSVNILSNFKYIQFGNDVRYPRNTLIDVFKNSIISHLIFDDLVNSTIKQNYLTFSDKMNNPFDLLNSTILNLDLYMYNVRLSNAILDILAFEKLEKLTIEKHLTEIETETFKELRNLKYLKLNLFSFKQFYHKTSLKWLKNLNKLVRVNYSDSLQLKNSKRIIIFLQQYYFNELKLNRIYTYPDEDFCLFEHFPFENYIFPAIFDCSLSCLFLWLVQYEKYFNDEVNLNCDLKPKPTQECDYEKMRNLCFGKEDELNFSSNEYQDYYFLYNRNYVLKSYDLTISIVLLPLTCITGILLNLLNIIVLRNRLFLKAFQNRMYKQMLLNSVVNMIICMLYLIKLSIKCIDPINNFCLVFLVTNKIYRYVTLTLVNYIGNALKTFSNLIQLSISLDRFILSTDKRNPFLNTFANMDLVKFLICNFLLSFLLNTVKLFEYDYDIDYTKLKYPIIQENFYNFTFIYSYLNIFNILISNLGLILIQFFIDIYLFRFVKKSMRHKELLITDKNNLKKNNSKHNTNNLKSERNIKLMIITNSMCSLVLHSPDLLISIYMATAYFYADSVLFYVENFDLFSFILSDLGDVIYLFGYSMNFFFFYYFNGYFRKSLKNLFKIAI
jgi:hypothetical protein